MNTENTADNTENLVDTEDLGKFEETFFSKDSGGATEHAPEEKVEEDVPEETPEIEDDPLATEDDTDADAEAEDEDPDEEEAPEEETPPAKKGKKSFQERINELTAKAREAERREQEALRRIADIEARRTPEVPEEKVEPTPLRQQLPPEAPNPDAVDDKGEPIYQLGEFDPQYIRDLTKFTIAEETKALREQQAAEDQANQISAAQQELAAQWDQKVTAVAEEIPEIRENIAVLADTFQNIDPEYGEYLATTIMESERGPEIMNYLSQNIGEAQAIVASGPRAATLALGRLEARFIKDEPATEEQSDDTTLVSKAPPPPPSTAKGRGARTVIRPDTDDLDAFEKVFFK